MRLSGLLNTLRRAPLYQQARDAPATQAIRLLRAAQAPFAAALAADGGVPTLILTAEASRARDWEAQLGAWSDASIHRFAASSARPYERVPRGGPSIEKRLSALCALWNWQQARANQEPPPIVIASAAALMMPTLTPAGLRTAQLTLSIDMPISRHSLLKHLLGNGYEPTNLVVAPGQFARRGGIIDLFPIAAAAPVRVELDDDRIASLRRFDPIHQRSTGRIDATAVSPARELLPSDGPAIARRIATWLERKDPEASDALATATPCPNLEYYLPYAGPLASLLDHLPAKTRILIEEPAALSAQFTQEERAAQSRRADADLPPDYPLPYLSGEALERQIAAHRHLQFQSGAAPGAIATPFQAPPRFAGNLSTLLRWLRERMDAGESAVLVSGNAARLAELWYEQENYLPIENSLREEPAPGSLRLVRGASSAGWSLRAGAASTLHLLSDTEIFGWSRPPRRRARPRVAQSRLNDLRPGTFVVHEDYGIGRFIGTQQRRLAGIRREFLRINYAGEDILFVPIHHADRVSRYIGAEGHEPKLNTLGKPLEWERTRQRAEKAAAEEARELLAIYAARARAPGIAISSDTPWQHELEARFPYDETPDQQQALQEIKADLERPRPMDRLLCGDVGYGKTEVALRAAFKVVMDGRQVAILAPTTVLAQQHLQTFRYRLAPFPLRIETLSRLQDAVQQKEVLAALRAGQVDIVIGTHRLLSADVEFARLGLLVIDDEQRFGVRHKEHFKRLRAQLDVLTMTATPIPRTLFMALSGTRDISQMRSPPEERLPVLTQTAPYDEMLARQAILREIERGGQIYYIHNRVRSIEAARERLMQLVPEARISIAHGQLPQTQLAEIMASFARGESDLLLATTIVEAGLDIPNANTLIVERADRFGLAQLYQLRGRVGRAQQQAYALFFHPEENRLRHDARERLLTIAEHSELGAGWQVALRDLELRGGGGVLSTRQSGHVAAIGLHLYARLLAAATAEGRATPQEKATARKTPPTNALILDLPLPAFLPEDYLPALEQRLQIYRRIGDLTTREEIATLRAELHDRFGPPPRPLEGLLFQMTAKMLAQEIGANALISRGRELQIRLPALSLLDRAALQNRLPPGARVTRPALTLPLDEAGEWQARLLALLQALAKDEGYARARAALLEQKL